MANYDEPEFARELPAPQHEAALRVLSDCRDDAVQRAEHLHREHSDVLQAADRARREINAAQELVESYDRAIAVLLREDEAKIAESARRATPPVDVRYPHAG